METKRSYFDKDFISSLEARPIRILSEYLHPAKAFQKNNVTNTIVFFGSARGNKPSFLRNSSTGNTPNNEKQTSHNQNKHLAENYFEATKLAYKLTKWSKNLSDTQQKYFICSGGGPGIMEAANRGAYLARGKSVGLSITLPCEQFINPYISDELCFNFHYFFMRKYWFMYYAKAVVVFPGGFGTCDELFEMLTLIQTKKIKKPLPIILHNKSFWQKLINFDLLIEWGTISKEDLDYFYFSENVDQSYNQIIRSLT